MENIIRKRQGLFLKDLEELYNIHKDKSQWKLELDQIKFIVKNLKDHNYMRWEMAFFHSINELYKSFINDVYEDLYLNYKGLPKKSKKKIDRSGIYCKNNYSYLSQEELEKNIRPIIENIFWKEREINNLEDILKSKIKVNYEETSITYIVSDRPQKNEKIAMNQAYILKDFLELYISHRICLEDICHRLELGLKILWESHYK